MKTSFFGAVAILACALPGAAGAQSAGEVVLSYYRGGSQLYPATVRSVSGNQVTLLWDDGTTSDVPRNAVRQFDWMVGTNVSCKWTDGRYYPARITQMGADGRTLNIVWTQDGTTARTNTGRCRSAG